MLGSEGPKTSEEMEKRLPFTKELVAEDEGGFVLKSLISKKS